MKWINMVTRYMLCFILMNQINIGHAAWKDRDDLKDRLTIKKQNEPLFSYSAQGKPPSTFTIKRYQEIKNKLPFDDTRDLAESKKGLLAKPTYLKIMADAGHVAWEMSSYNFLLQGKELTSIHPSLYRQAILNMNYGLYEVVPNHIYQIRGFDLANMTLIKGKNSWIIIDPLTAKETARAAIQFANEKLGKRPVSKLVFNKKVRVSVIVFCKPLMNYGLGFLRVWRLKRLRQM